MNDYSGIKEENSDYQQINIEGTFTKNQLPYVISSSGINSSSSNSSIIVNGRVCSQNKDGLCILVWDNNCRVVNDSVTFDGNGKAKDRTYFKDITESGMKDLYARW